VRNDRYCSQVSRPTVLVFAVLLAAVVVQSPIAVFAQSQSYSVEDPSAVHDPLLGSVPSGRASSEPMRLTILDALDRGLKYNLGIVLSQQGSTAAAAQRYRALSALLPNVNAHLADSYQQASLISYGLPLSPGENPILGPFSLTDMRAALNVNIFDFSAFNNYRSAKENVRAAKFSYQNTRDLVVLVVGYQYLSALADQSRVEAAQAQFNTAETLYKQALDLHNAGMVPGIDVLRAQVEMQSQQQRLLERRNEYDKQLISVGRVLGLPGGQAIILADKIPPPAPLPHTMQEDIERARENRSDYKQVQAALEAALHARRAAVSERLPSASFSGDYGTIGSSPVKNHETFTVAASVHIPVFEGGRIKGDIMQADAELERSRAQFLDLGERIDYEVRVAFLDYESATQQLEVATSNLDLARQQVAQSRDRFAAGVTNNVEVVQAQEAQATAEENYISSLFSHDFSKLSLARAVGIAEDATRKFLGGK